MHSSGIWIVTGLHAMLTRVVVLRRAACPAATPGSLLRFRFPGPAPDFQNQQLWGSGSGIGWLASSPEDPWAHCHLRLCSRFERQSWTGPAESGPDALQELSPSAFQEPLSGLRLCTAGSPSAPPFLHPAQLPPPDTCEVSTVLSTCGL